ncbi:STAS domain-containing protein [Planosporangium sp. 12N6]|uniref:STAS domain-containing protein n=1 Tax=Planosporangium spinosum TaxID=3402278 RepID=UPI003CEF1196
MTALPTSDRQSLNLICDKCGHQLAGISSTLRNWDVVWALVTKHGWAGSPAAFGPHYCPDCAVTTTPTVPHGPDVPAPNPQFLWHASIRMAGDTTVVELHGNLDILVADNLREVLEQACADRRNVVLDLADVRLIDSTALGELVRAHQTLNEKGGNLCLAAPSPFIIAVLDAMPLRQGFPTFVSSEQAVDWIAVGCP